MLKFLQNYGLPISLSEAGPGIDEIIVLTHWLMLVLFIGWGAFFIISLVKFRASKNPDADHMGVKSHLSSVLEVAVAVVEIVLLIGFAFPIWANRVNDVPTSGDGAVYIRVVAQQYVWNIHYPGADGIFGSSKPERTVPVQAQMMTFIQSIKCIYQSIRKSASILQLRM